LTMATALCSPISTLYHRGTIALSSLERIYAQTISLSMSAFGWPADASIISKTRTSETTRRRFVTSTTPVLLTASWKDDLSAAAVDRPSWSEEWKKLGMGAELVNTPTNFPTNLLFVQLGFGVDQHGDRTNATKAAIRAVRNAIEFNSIPGMITHVPGGRKNMLIHVKLGVPNYSNDPVAAAITNVDKLEVAKVFPYGKLLPIQVTVGGLEFATGRVVEELGDVDDVGICVAACISIGYDSESDDAKDRATAHKTYSTKDGY
jgi:uncharacterized protein (TIGR02058 family)